MIQKMGRKTVAVEGNVTLKENAERIIQSAIDHFGKIDILVNNAGATKTAMLHRMTEEQWDEVVNIHLKGPFRCIQAASEHRMEERNGMMTSSGLVGTKGQINASTAKGGIFSLTKPAARKLAGYGVMADVICLGIVSTPTTEKIRTDPKLRETYMGRI